MTAMGLCVNERCSLAVNIKFGFTALARSHPEFRQVRLDVSVEGRVDLDHVDAARQDIERMLFAVLHPGRIEDSLPVFVRPAGSTDADLRGYFHCVRQIIACWQVSIGQRRGGGRPGENFLLFFSHARL